MNEFHKARLARLLDALPEERVQEVLDYIEFLMARHGVADTGAKSTLQALAEKVEDTLRVAKMPAGAIKGTMGAMESAGRFVEKIAEAGKAAITEVTRGKEAEEKADKAAGPPDQPPSGEPPAERPPP